MLPRTSCPLAGKASATRTANSVQPRTFRMTPPRLARGPRRGGLLASIYYNVVRAATVKKRSRFNTTDSLILEADRGVEGEEPHDGVVHRPDLTEVRAGRIQVRIGVVLPVEQVLHVHAELDRPAAPQTEVARDGRVHHRQTVAAHAVHPEREHPLLERGRLISRCTHEPGVDVEPCLCRV